MIKCAEVLDDYYREHVAVRCVATERVGFAIAALNRFFGAKDIADVDIPMCRDYCDIRGVSDSTVRRELGVLRTAALHAVKWRRLTADKMPSIELPPESEAKQLWLYQDELITLLDVAEQTDQRAFRFCQIAYHTASRRHAIETLRWEQVDLEARRINLASPGEKTTRKRRPIVPISESMAGELRAMKKLATTEWVLGDSAAAYRAFERVARKAGLLHLPKRGMREAGRLSPHALRHSRATHLLEAGKAPFAVASLLGDTVSTVLRVYGHACPDYLESVVS